MARKAAEPQKHTGTSPWEWAAAALGAAVIAFAICYMVWYGLTRSDGPPVLVVERQEIEQVGNLYLLQIVVRNEGHSSAAAVPIEGSLLEGDKVLETSEVTIDFVPENSEQRIYLQFTRDPKRFTLEVRALGSSPP